MVGEIINYFLKIAYGHTTWPHTYINERKAVLAVVNTVFILAVHSCSSPSMQQGFVTDIWLLLGNYT